MNDCGLFIYLFIYFFLLMFLDLQRKLTAAVCKTYHTANDLLLNPFSAKPIFGRKKKIGKSVATLVFMLEGKILSSFFSQMIELFRRTMKKI